MASVTSQIESLEQLSGSAWRQQVVSSSGCVVWPQSMWLGMVYESDERTIDYLMLHLALANTTENAITVRREQIVVTAGGRQLVAGDLPRPARLPLRGDMTEKRPSEWRVPDVITIAPGQAAWFWCPFAPLPESSSLPAMTLRVGEPGSPAIDLNALARDRLALETTLSGPRQALAIMRIKGHLDAVSTYALVSELDRHLSRGIARVVLYWDADADPIDSTLVDWLLASRKLAARVNPSLQAFARIPDLRQLHLAQSPVPSDQLNFESPNTTDPNQAVQIHSIPEQAVSAALQEVLPALPAAELLEQFRIGHPWVQSAILSNPSVDLPAEAWDIVQSRLASSNVADQRTAVRALTRMADTKAVKALQDLLNEAHPEEVRRDALLALVMSNLPTAEHSLQTLLEQEVLAPQPWVVEALSQAPHSRFAPWIADCLHSSHAEVRVAALLGLDRLGVEGLISWAVQSLDDNDRTVRRAAFEILVRVSNEDHAAARAVTNFAFRAFAELEFDDALQEVIERSRDARFAPLLLGLLDSPAENLDRHSLILLLGSIGDETTSRELVRRFPRMSMENQFATLRAIEDWDPASTLELAALALKSSDSEVLVTAGRVLRDSGDQDGLSQVIQRFETASSSEREILASVLAESRAPEARQALRSWRDRAFTQQDEGQIQAAQNALSAQRQLSAGWSMCVDGYEHTQAEELLAAADCFQLSLEIDPELSTAAAALGNVRLKLNQLNEALESYRQALAVDAYDDQALTGVGIVMARQGQPEEAVAFVLANAARCPKNMVFEYNTACVYGRAVEWLQSQPVSEHRDRLIQDYSARAIEHLRDSIHLRFNDFLLLESDPDLHSLRKFPGFGDWDVGDSEQ